MIRSMIAGVVSGLLLLGGCGTAAPEEPLASVPAGAGNPPQDERIAELRGKPLYAFAEQEVDVYLRHLHEEQPQLQRRVVHLARRNLGQPYELYLLGESPFETIDDDPIYRLDASDCVTFVEHVYAMALTRSWDEFLAMLQRIRYSDGHISVLTRNHYTEADWNRNNDWLVRDVTNELGGEAVVRFSQRVDRQRFFRNRYELEAEIPVETIDELFIPYEAMEQVMPRLRDGDVVNFVSGRDGGYWVGHVGLVTIGEDGTVNLLHSTPPQVIEEPMAEYIARLAANAAGRDAEGRARFYGFKFLRATEDPMAYLQALDGPEAPAVTVPAASGMTFEQYLGTFGLE